MIGYPKQTGKKKEPTVKSLDAKLWRLVSEYIRRRDALKFSGGEITRCITCGKTGHFKEFDCGHFISRRHLATKFEEKNLGSQCPGCNLYGSGKQFEYGLAIDRIYGPGTAQLLLHKSKQYVKWSAFEYNILIQEYKQKLKELKHGKTTINR